MTAKHQIWCHCCQILDLYSREGRNGQMVVDPLLFQDLCIKKAGPWGFRALGSLKTAEKWTRSAINGSLRNGSGSATRLKKLEANQTTVSEQC